jgi:hypothetical protein
MVYLAHKDPQRKKEQSNQTNVPNAHFTLIIIIIIITNCSWRGAPRSIDLNMQKYHKDVVQDWKSLIMSIRHRSRSKIIEEWFVKRYVFSVSAAFCDLPNDFFRCLVSDCIDCTNFTPLVAYSIINTKGLQLAALAWVPAMNAREKVINKSVKTLAKINLMKWGSGSKSKAELI